MSLEDVSDKWKLTESGRVYLDIDDRGFIRGDAEHRGTINLRGKLWRLVHILHLNSDLREKHKTQVKRLKRTSLNQSRLQRTDKNTFI